MAADDGADNDGLGAEPELHAAEPADLPLLTAAVAAYLNQAESQPGKHADAEPIATPTPNQPPAIYTARHEVIDWDDISTNAPGAAARERALAERSAAPFRTAISRLLRIHNEERAWRIGADGEEPVAARLAKLGPDWRTIHAVPVGDRGSDIDHVVIGPAGVFTINAKNHAPPAFLEPSSAARSRSAASSPSRVPSAASRSKNSLATAPSTSSRVRRSRTTFSACRSSLDRRTQRRSTSLHAARRPGSTTTTEAHTTCVRLLVLAVALPALFPS